MNKKKVLALVTALTLVATVGIGATLAYFTDKADVENVFTMGHVDITLTENEVEVDEETGEYVQKDDETAITEEGLGFEDVVPGQTVPKNPTVTVAEGSEDAYIRVQLTFEGLDNTQKEQLLAGIEILDGWTLANDGYYYYKEAVSAEDSVVLFEEVTIPGAWGNEMAEKEFKILVNADAIQADYVDDILVIDQTSGDVIAWNLGDVSIEEYTAPTPETTAAE